MRRFSRGTDEHESVALPPALRSRGSVTAPAPLVRAIARDSVRARRTGRSLALALLASTGTAHAQSAIDAIDQAFRGTSSRAMTSPALGPGGARMIRAESGPLESLDDTRGLDGGDGPSPEAASVHPTIAALRNALWHWLDPDERRRLATVDATRTVSADTAAVQLFLVDRALRRFAPMALGALSRTAEATALRRAPAVRTVALAEGVCRLPVVARALRRHDAVAVATAASFARRLTRLGASIQTTVTDEDERQHAADRAVTAAAEAARTRDAGEVALVIAETGIAWGGRAERARVVDEAIHLLEETVAIARGTPAVERPLPPLPVRLDPDADAPSTEPSRAPRGRGGSVRSSATRAPSTTETAPRPSPSARCYEDPRCFENER